MTTARSPLTLAGYVFLVVLLVGGCYAIKSSSGGGEVSGEPVRVVDPEDIVLPDRYQIEVVAEGLTFPTGITFDEEGRPFVTESGYAYGEVWTVPKVVRIEPDGSVRTVVSGTENEHGPWNGIYFYEGDFYISDGGVLDGGKILRISGDGEISTLTEDLPGLGDHHANGPVVLDGYVYFGQGTATNSGVVGGDNADFGWLERYPEFHDIPCEDVTVSGTNYETENALEGDNETAVTGAFSPYGTSTQPGQVIRGEIPCSGSVLRVPTEGGALELVAWGFRNPFGLAVSPNDNIFITDNAYDDRGSRPVWGSGDLLWQLQMGMWYGWPDFSGSKSLSTEEFQPPGKDPVEPVLENYPNDPPQPSAILEVHSSSNGFDFSTNDRFGYTGEAFIAQFGDMSPDVGKVLSPVGFKVVRVDPSTGIIENFAVNGGSENGPASWQESGGLERPVAARFDPSGEALYIVDFGIVQMTDEGPRPREDTGMVWKITRGSDE